MLKAEGMRAQVRVNGIPVESLYFRHREESEDFDIVIDDPGIEGFALTDGFDLEVRDKECDWRQVTLETLKSILSGNDDPLPATAIFADFLAGAIWRMKILTCGRPYVLEVSPGEERRTFLNDLADEASST